MQKRVGFHGTLLATLELTRLNTAMSKHQQDDLKLQNSGANGACFQPSLVWSAPHMLAPCNRLRFCSIVVCIG